MKRLIKSVFTTDTIRLLALIVAPVWGAGLYAGQQVGAALERQVESCQQREDEYRLWFKELLNRILEQPAEEEDDGVD